MNCKTKLKKLTGMQASKSKRKEYERAKKWQYTVKIQNGLIHVWKEWGRDNIWIDNARKLAELIKDSDTKILKHKAWEDP